MLSSLQMQQKIQSLLKLVFFRGFAYRVLAYTYGGVPIELEEVTSPKRDYTRATRAEVYQQCIDDLVFCHTKTFRILQALKLTVGSARKPPNHYLAELYLATPAMG